jgi:hypothetical protein
MPRPVQVKAFCTDVFCTDAWTQYGVQNAEPGSLLTGLRDSSFNSAIPDTYYITLSVYDCATRGCATDLLASGSIQVDTVPEPGCLMILGTAPAGLGLACRHAPRPRRQNPAS